jgi:predicted DNA-binding ribbon-helix-helix protein
LIQRNDRAGGVSQEFYMKSAVIKRSVTIDGHKTSVSLEDAFWDGLIEVAKQSNVSVAKLVAEIEQSRSTINLSSAIRIFLLQHYRAQFSSRYRVQHIKDARGESKNRPNWFVKAGDADGSTS